MMGLERGTKLALSPGRELTYRATSSELERTLCMCRLAIDGTLEALAFGHCYLL